MYRDRIGSHVRRARRAFQLIQLPGLPGHGGQFVTERIGALAGKDSSDHQQARFGAESARCNALRDTGTCPNKA